MLKFKTLSLIMSIITFLSSIFLFMVAILEGIQGDVVSVAINAFCSIIWMISFSIWFDMYLNCED